jgi:Pyruvate/2-oxoacid:ferredoxin oxidoreductase delta subunit
MCTADRSKNSILNKQSVLKIVNDDNNCFWYALACLMYPENKMIRDSRKSTRIKVASDICKKCKLVWNQPISTFSIPFVEDTYDCNIYILNLNQIPMLGSNINLWNCLLYKTNNRHKKQYFLLYDDVNQHYDCITNIKGISRM